MFSGTLNIQLVVTMRSLIYFFFVHTSLFLPGYVAATNSRFFKKNRGLEICFGYVVSIAFFAILSTTRYVLNLPVVISIVLFWIAMIGSLLVFIRQKLYDRVWAERFVFLCFLLISLFSIAFTSLSFTKPYSIIPDPERQANRNYNVLNVKVLNVAQTNANDNYLPYRHAQFFVNRSNPETDSFLNEWGVHFFQRTPLLGAVTANYFNVLNDKPPVDYPWSASANDQNHTYEKFQVIAQILNLLFVIPAFYLLLKMFNKRTAIATSCFLIPSQYFLYNSFFSWPKSFVAFFILLSWLLLLEKSMRYTILAGIVSGIAYLTHDLAVLYIGASFLLLITQKRFKETAFFTLATSLCMLPWIFVSSIIYRRPSSFIYYPLSIHDIPQVSQKRQVVDEFLHTSPLKILWIRVSNFLYIVSPYQLFTSEGGQGTARRAWALGLFSVPGAIGFGLIVPAIFGAFRRLAKLDFWILAVIPIILSTVVIGWPKGLAALHFAEASVVLFVGLGVAMLVTLRNKLWLFLAFVVNIAQLIYFVLYSYGFTEERWLRSTQDIACLAIMIAIISLTSAILFHSTKNGKNRLTRFVGI